MKSRLALLAVTAATVVLSVAGCSSDDAPPNATTTFQTTSILLGKNDCGTLVYPNRGTQGRLIVNAGSVSCDAARSVVGQYVARPESAKINVAAPADIDGWHCASTTGLTPDNEGVYARCTRGGDELLVIDPEWKFDGRLADAAEYLRADEIDIYHFTAGDGRWSCMLSSDVVGCAGKMAGGDAVEMVNGTTAKFTASGDRFTSNKARTLKPGTTLATSSYLCTAGDDGALTCTTHDDAHGFTLTPGGQRVR
ncbi:MAG: hypothetical protein QM658_04695 [Gordonia sp. (in: high G+C Gram-positive bacteria)]